MCAMEKIWGLKRRRDVVLGHAGRGITRITPKVRMMFSAILVSGAPIYGTSERMLVAPSIER